MTKLQNTVVGEKNMNGPGLRKFTVENADDDSWMNASSEELAEQEAKQLEMQAAAVRQRQAKIGSTVPVEQKISAAEFERMHQNRRAQISQVDPITKRNMELLVGIGRATRDVKVENEDGSKVVFSIRTLKSSEIKSILRHSVNQATNNDAIKLTSIEGIYSTRDDILVRSIYAIDGVSIDIILGLQGLTPEAKLEAKLAFVDELDDSVMAYLYSEYADLTKNNGIRNQIRTEDDVKEVNEALSKSGQGGRA